MDRPIVFQHIANPIAMLGGAIGSHDIVKRGFRIVVHLVPRKCANHDWGDSRQPTMSRCEHGFGIVTPCNVSRVSYFSQAMEHNLYQTMKIRDEATALEVMRQAPGLDVNYRYPFYPQDTLLMLAASLGFVGVIRNLLDSGAEDVEDPCGRRAVQIATYCGKETAALFLLERGCDPNVRGGWLDETMLMWAAEQGMIKLMRALVNAGADVEAVNSNGRTAFCYAYGAGKDQAACFLVARSATIKDEAFALIQRNAEDDANGLRRKSRTLKRMAGKMPRLFKMLSDIHVLAHPLPVRHGIVY